MAAEINPNGMHHKSSTGHITIGDMPTPWGLKGEIKIRPLTDFPERFNAGQPVYIDGTAYIIEKRTQHRGAVIIKLNGIDTPEAASRLRHKTIDIPESEIQPLPEGQYYRFDIIGLEVWTTGGELLGTLSDILTTAGNDVYVVKTGKKDILIPAIKDVVKSIDLKNQRIVIEAIEGLLD